MQGASSLAVVEAALQAAAAGLVDTVQFEEGVAATLASKFVAGIREEAEELSLVCQVDRHTVRKEKN